MSLCSACNTGSSSTDNTSPTLPTDAEIIFSNIDTTSATATWEAATDDVTTASDLEYKAVISENSEDIDTTTEADDISEASVVMDWTTDTTTTNLTDLTNNTTYFLAVLVRDEAGNLSLYEPQSFTAGNDSAPETSRIGFSAITSTTAVAFWSSANDDDTSSADLEYKIVIDTDTTAIDSIDEVNAITGDALLTDWTADTTNIDLSGLTAGTNYTLAVLVRDVSENKALFTPQTFSTVASDGPVVPDDLAADSPTYTTVHLTWSAATDDETAEADLVYKIVYATSYFSIDTIAEADAIETMEDGLALDWTANTTETTVEDLTPGTNYKFTVLVKDEDDNIAIYTPTSSETTDGKRVFQSEGHNADFGGISGTDDFCESDSNKPLTGTYKAMVSDGENRIACATPSCTESGSSENVDWVFSAGTTYIRADDETVIGIANDSGIFDFALQNGLSSSSAEIWTGLTTEWAYNTSCIGWTSSTGDMESEQYGAVGISDQTDYTVINVYLQFCDRTNVSLICVEQ